VPDDAVDGLPGGDEAVVGSGGLAVALGAPGVEEGDLCNVVEPITRGVAPRDVQVARFRVIMRRAVGIGGLESLFVYIMLARLAFFFL
jgi:hypothetical protein